MRSARSDLGRMRDDQHLRAICQCGQTTTDRIGGGPAYTPVDLVEDHRQTLGVRRQADLQRQQETG